MMVNMNRKMKVIFTLLIILNLLVLGVVSYLWIQSDLSVKASKNRTANKNIKQFTLKELALYNGVDPKRPIYLALDGYVYDVTKGKEYYEVGGPYHDLAGRDASKELHLVGGGIIKRKYPIIGRL